MIPTDMEKILDQELDLTQTRLRAMEEHLVQMQEQQTVVQEQIVNMMLSIKETQRYLIKLAKNQQDLTKRISQWPYLTISNNEE